MIMQLEHGYIMKTHILSPLLLDLSVDMPDGQVMEMGSMESVYEYFDTYARRTYF